MERGNSLFALFAVAVVIGMSLLLWAIGMTSIRLLQEYLNEIFPFKGLYISYVNFTEGRVRVRANEPLPPPEGGNWYLSIDGTSTPINSITQISSTEVEIRFKGGYFSPLVKHVLVVTASGTFSGMVLYVP